MKKKFNSELNYIIMALGFLQCNQACYYGSKDKKMRKMEVSLNIYELNRKQDL
jgi:hypothetical protein